MGRVSVTRVLGLIALVAWPLAARADGPPVSHRDKLYDVAVHGGAVYLVGYPGLLLRSEDLQRFERLAVDTRDALFAIDIAADGRGVVVGRSGLVLVTSDGGRSWAPGKSGTEEHLFDVEVVEGGKAWAVGHFGTIVHSVDGGVTWQPQSYDAALPSSGADGEGAAVVSSAELDNEGAAEEARLNGVSFADERRGYIVGEFGLVLTTADGGATWKRQRSATGKLLFDVRAGAGAAAVAVGVEGLAMETTDGGASWTVLDSGVEEHLLAVVQLGKAGEAAGALLLVGRDGVLLRRADGAAPLTKASAGVYAWLAGGAFLDARRGLLVGGRGHILRSRDGGRTFERISGR